MGTKIITLIQFTSGIDLTGGYDDIYRNRIYYLNTVVDSFEFFMGEDDDGDSQHEEHPAISVFESLDDLLNDDYHCYVGSVGLTYSTMEIEVNIDEDGKPIWDAA